MNEILSDENFSEFPEHLLFVKKTKYLFVAREKYDVTIFTFNGQQVVESYEKELFPAVIIIKDVAIKNCWVASVDDPEEEMFVFHCYDISEINSSDNTYAVYYSPSDYEYLIGTSLTKCGEMIEAYPIIDDNLEITDILYLDIHQNISFEDILTLYDISYDKNLKVFRENVTIENNYYPQYYD